MKKYLLFIPIVILMAWTGYHEFKLQSGKTAILKITGYDPRDLLSGHYLTYQVEYPNLKCDRYGNEGFVNIKTGEISKHKTDALEIGGYCHYNRFKAGIERFYIPQEHAAVLDKLLRGNKYPATIEVRITDSGKAYVKDLFFDSIQWQEFIKTSYK